MPWLSKAELRRLLRSIARAERRADRAESALELERLDNNKMTRHMTNMFLRKSNTFPLVDKPAVPVEPMEVQRGPRYDPGELVALEAEAERLGLKKEDARSLFMREKDLDVLM